MTSTATTMPWPWVLPFAGLLLAIAILPLLARRYWEKDGNKLVVVAGFSAPVLLYFIKHQEWTPLLHAGHEYLSFVCLLASLFIVSGGIVIKGNFSPTPKTNTMFLLVGAVLANFIGTTGASMLLIRPFLRTNSQRKNVVHLPLFFIFIVGNVGGMLTPLGDPPLFLGYLRGVPFFWTLKLIPLWLFVTLSLAMVFYVWERLAFRKEDVEAKHSQALDLKISGAHNFIFFGGILLGVFLPSPWREFLMLAMAMLSLMTSEKEWRSANHFTFHPIREVAILFAGIFITMIPALALVSQHGQSLGVATPIQYFWATGILSSFLDNAPTYLTFFSMAQASDLAGLRIAGVPEILLMAISAGAVCMGANSYIGNGPNFLVKAIADKAHFKTPSFFAYIGYAAILLLPVYFVATLIFL